jgi:hypothetical protein
MARLDWERATRRQRVTRSAKEGGENGENVVADNERRWLAQYALACAVVDAIGDGRPRSRPLGGDTARIVRLLELSRSRNLALQSWCNDHHLSVRRVREQLGEGGAQASAVRIGPNTFPLPFPNAAMTERLFQLQLETVARRLDADPAEVWTALDAQAEE